MDEARLISELTRWDSNAFHKLYELYYKKLVSYSFAFINDNDASEDIVQDIFTRLLTSKPMMDSNAQLQAFLFHSVRNSCVSHLRHKEAVANFVHVSSREGRAAELMEDEIFAEDIYEELFKAIDELPDRAREIFLLSIDGKSNHEIAEALNVSIATVKTHKYRGMKVLKGKLGDKALLLLATLVEI